MSFFASYLYNTLSLIKQLSVLCYFSIRAQCNYIILSTITNIFYSLPSTRTIISLKLIIFCVNFIYCILNAIHISQHNELLNQEYKLFHMPWFESSKDKQFRELVQSRMEICLAKPDKYEEAKTFLASLVTKPNQKAIEMIVDQIKQVIKDDGVEPVRKLRAMTLLRDLMETQSKALGKYVVKKILKRLTIFAEHRKNQKDQNRGANIFKCKKSQQKYGIQFLKTLLLALQQWGKNWPRQVDGPFHDFQAAYNDLLMQKQVTFPIDTRKANKAASPSPFGKNNRSSRQQFNSPPKITPQAGMRGALQNPPSKPAIKQRTLLSGQAAQYVNQMIEMLNLLSSTLLQNQQFGQIWGIIKAYVDQFKTVDQKGNFLVAKMIQKGEQNPELFQAIQSNSDFLAELQKDTGIVDRKNQSYGKYNGKYVKKCKKIALSLSVFIQQPGSSQSNPNNLSAGNNRPAIQTSIHQKVQQVRGLQKPKAMEEGNRYGSSAALRNQLQINLQPVKKEDFNSNTHKFNENSEGSSRYNSVSGNIPGDKNRNSQSQFNVSSEFKEKQTSGEEKKISSPSKGNQKKTNAEPEVKKNSHNLKQISKITEKNENQSENNINKLDFDNQVPEHGKNNISGSFGDFQVSGEKQQKQDSNSNFFKEQDMKDEGIMQTGVRKGRKPPNKVKLAEDQNFFQVSIKSKQQSQNISEFNKSKTNSKSAEKKQANQNEERSNPGFDTFKNPNQLVNVIQQLKKSVKSQKSQKSDVSNPFATKINDVNNSFNRSQDFADNPFSSKIPDVNSAIQNPFQSNFQKKETYQRDEDNPFSTKIQRKGNFQTGNPFASKIEDPGIGVFSIKQKDDDENKSKSSNPFSSKNDKSFEKSSIKHKKKSQIQNPFDEKSQKSQNSSKLDNPFQNPLKNQASYLEGDEKKIPSDKSLSQRGSFVDAKNIEKISAKNVESMEDPFQNQPSKQLSERAKNNRKKNNLTEINENSMIPKQKSFQGYDFQDFLNASQQKSQTNSVRNEVRNVQTQNKQNQSQLNISDFGMINNQQNKSQSSDFFNQKKYGIENPPNKNERSFDFFQSNNTRKQPQAERDFFQTTNKSLGKQKQYKNQQNKQFGKNSFDQIQFGFQDFQNISKSSQQKSSKNPFSSFQQSKGVVPPIKLLPQPDSKEGSQRSSDEWNKFDNLQEKKNESELNEKQRMQQSRYQASEENQSQNRRRVDTPLFNQFKRKTIQSRDPYSSNEKKYVNDKQPQFGNQQKSLSIHFDEPSPFQKKQMPWDYTLAALPSSARYNVTPTDISQKKSVLFELQTDHQKRLNAYKELNQKLNYFKKIYSGCIERVGEARQQKKQFQNILKRLEETNEIKQKQIEELIKKTKKTEELKRRILENERALYQRMKNQKQSRETEAIYKGKTGNKWDRFNQNLKKQRQEVQLQKTVSNYSYYA